MSYLIRIFFLTAAMALFNINLAVSQETSLSDDQFYENIVETISDNIEEEDDFSGFFDELVYYKEHPLDLNLATAGELTELRILNDFQIASLINYRKEKGPIFSAYELLYIPGFREIDVRRLQNITSCKEVKYYQKKNKYSLRQGNSEAIIRWQKVLEKQEGYREIPDSVLAINPDKSRYVGSPDRIYVRYRFKLQDHFNAGFIADKDAGEQFFKGSNKQGFDFNSAHIIYQNEQSWIKGLAIGDYHIRLGQGLLVWTGYSVGYTSYINDIVKRSAVLKGNLSGEENRFLRGAAARFGSKEFSLLLFGSSNRIDATISETDSNQYFIESFKETGYHNTPSELRSENRVELRSMGASVRFDGQRLKIGVNSTYYEFYKPVIKSNSFYRNFGFTGTSSTGISVDYRYLARVSQFFGETAFANGSYATLNGLLFYLRPGLSIGTVYRHFDPAYYSYYASSLGQNAKIANENGFYFGGDFSFTGNRLRIYSDIFSFPWLKYNVNAPSEGYEFFVEAGREFENADLAFRYRIRNKPQNLTSGDKLEKIGPFIKSSYLINGKYRIGRFFNFQSRIEVSDAGFDGDPKKYGILIAQDAGWNNDQSTVGLNIRIAYFDIADYNARIYSYEKDVLYSFTSQQYYGKGWRYMIFFKWRPIDWFTLWVKVSSSIFLNEESIGSDLSEISGNHKSEIKIQTAFRF